MTLSFVIMLTYLTCDSDAKRPCSTCVRSHNHTVTHAGPDVVLPPFPECTFDEG